MAENGNGRNKGTFGPLITYEEMASAFEIAKLLGVEDEFGGSSPLGGIVVLILGITLEIGRLKAKIERLEIRPQVDDL